METLIKLHECVTPTSSTPLCKVLGNGHRRHSLILTTPTEYIPTTIEKLIKLPRCATPTSMAQYG